MTSASIANALRLYRNQRAQELARMDAPDVTPAIDIPCGDGSVIILAIDTLIAAFGGMPPSTPAQSRNVIDLNDPAVRYDLEGRN